MPTASVEIEKLFDTNRLEKPWHFFIIALYFPLGLVIALIRFFIGVHAFLVACILPKASPIRCIILRCMCSVLGIIVRQRNTHNCQKSVKVVVTNHLTPLDHLAVDLVHPCIMPGVWDLPRALNWGLGYRDLGVKQGRDVLIQNVKKHLQESEVPVLAHPEGASTSGKVGLLLFSTWPFSLDHPVQPIAITVSRLPGISVYPSVLGSRWWSDLFWFLFVPYTLFILSYLPPATKEDQESVEEFSKRVQNAMAKELGIVPTLHTCADKVEFAKRMLHVPQSPPPQHRLNQSLSLPRRSHAPVTSSSPRLGPDVSNMAIQVKEVLPHVPLEVICSDLAVTRCVDTTITRLLEGAVSFEPEVESVNPSLSDKSSSSAVSSNSASVEVLCGASAPSDCTTGDSYPLNTAAKNFGRTAGERMRSYQERKALLLENARRRYLQKHGLL